MRESRFRGIDVNTNQMVYGNLIQNNDASFIVDKVEHSYIGYCCDCDRPYSGQYQVKPNTVGKYTGLKDINGIGIYVGDIVEVTRKHWNNCNKEYLEKTTKELGIIEFFKNLQMSLKVKEEGYYLYQPLLWALEDDSEIKIIGNIYENSELLERE